MSATLTLLRPRTKANLVHPICAEIARLWRALARELFDTYRPERHYMRGPGPKWRAKHAQDGARRP
jgi:hypothetical protein